MRILSLRRYQLNWRKFNCANSINVDVMCGWPYEYSNHKQVSKTEMHRGIRIQRIKYSRFK